MTNERCPRCGKDMHSYLDKMPMPVTKKESESTFVFDVQLLYALSSTHNGMC